jgi:threonine/homoserine/homoserine lactone efflux protein
MDSTLIGFVTMTIVASLTPGPAIMAVCGTAIGSGTRIALVQIIGTQLGNTLYATVALLGITVLLSADERFFTGMQLAGASYLFWLGLQSIRSAYRRSAEPNQTVEAISIGAAEAIKRGFLVQLFNPKTMLYWFALLPPFLSNTSTMSARAFQLVGIGMAMDALAMSLYALLIGIARTLLTSGAAARRFQLTSGFVYVLAGTLLGIRALI